MKHDDVNLASHNGDNDHNDVDPKYPSHPQLSTQPNSLQSLTSVDLELARLDSSKKNGSIEISQEEPIKYKVIRGWILLNEGISVRNFYFSWLYVIYLGFILISFSTLEPQYINQTFNIPLEEMGKTTAVLYLIDYSIRLCFALIFGPMIDRYGRKFVLTVAILLISLGYLLIPLLSFSLFPGYLMAKSFLSAGMIALSMLPFSADYVDNSTKGIMTGMTYGVGFIGGAAAGVFIKSSLSMQFSYEIIYYIHAPILLVAGFLIRTGIKGGNTYYKVKTTENEPETQNKGCQWQQVKKAFKEIPWIPISVLFGVLGNTDFYIMTTGLMIWIKSLIPENEDPTMIATTYQVLFFGLSVITTVIAALKIDKIPHMRVIFPVLILATIGFFLIPFAPSAQNALVYVFFVLEGVSLPGVFVFSTYLAIRYNPPEIRGTLSGIGNGVGFLGAIFILSLGGFLHDHWRSDASFILYGGLLFLTLFIVTFIHFRMMSYSAKPNDTEMKKLASVEGVEAV